MANRRGKGGGSDGFPLLGLQNHCRQWLQSWNQMIASWQENNDKLDRVLKSRDITLPTKIYIFKPMAFPVVTYSCETWTIKTKNWWLQTVVLEKTPESPLDGKEIKSVNLKGDQPWIPFGRTDAEAPVVWSSDANSQFTGKVPDAGKDWGQKEKRASEDEMAEWHHRCNVHEFGQTSGDSEGQGVLVCCSPWGLKSWTWLGDWTTILIQFNSSTFNSLFHLALCVTSI